VGSGVRELYGQEIKWNSTQSTLRHYFSTGLVTNNFLQGQASNRRQNRVNAGEREGHVTDNVRTHFTRHKSRFKIFHYKAQIRQSGWEWEETIISLAHRLGVTFFSFCSAVGIIHVLHQITLLQLNFYEVLCLKCGAPSLP